MVIMMWMVSLPRLYSCRLSEPWVEMPNHTIPNRFDEGYGLNPEALDDLKADGVRLGYYGGLRHPFAG